MFTNSKVRAKITDDDPVFKTRYLGNVEVFVPSGTGCTHSSVQKLWDNSGEEKSMRKIQTIINVHGIFIKDIDKKDAEMKIYSIEDISFCNAESIANGKIFSWIAKEETSSRLLCHAVLCSTPEKAKSMALVMSRAFQIAYKDWKAEQAFLKRSKLKTHVKSKTSDINLQLKVRYQTDNPQDFKNDIHNSSNDLVNERYVNMTDNKSDKSCENSRKGSVKSIENELESKVSVTIESTDFSSACIDDNRSSEKDSSNEHSVYHQIDESFTSEKL